MSNDLTERERKTIRFALEDVDEGRTGAFDAAFANFGDDLQRRFEPGSFGSHEAADRAYMLFETWVHFVQDHPTVAMNPEAYRLAALATAFMQEVYQVVACAEPGDIPARLEVE
jgi:hypothetical protein